MSNKIKSKRQSIIELISYGFTDSEIADTLHISAQSGFEHSAQMKNRLARYMRVRGMSLEVIARQIGTKVSTLEKMGLDKLPTLDGIKIQMEIALEPLADIAQWDNEAASLFYRLQDALKCLK